MASKKPDKKAELSTTQQAEADFTQSALHTAKAQRRTASVELGRTIHLIEAVESCCERIPPPPPFKVSGRLSLKRTVEPVLLVSDWHLGDNVRTEETEGFGAFNYRIAERRVNQLYTGFTKYIKGQRTQHLISRLSVFVLGDMVSGGIHDELLTTEEWPPPVQAVKAGKLLARLVTDLGGHFKQVHTTFIGADNHSRITRKPRCKGKAAWSWSHVVDEIFRATLPDDPDRYSVTSPEAMQCVVEIQSTKFLLTHGDTIKSWSNIPFYGIERRLAQEATRRMRTPKGFDMMVMGHFHTPVTMPRLIINGSLQGTTEYDFSVGRHCGPCQISFMVHPDHGVYNYTKWWLS